jgi:hypothetical protein
MLKDLRKSMALLIASAVVLTVSVLVSRAMTLQLFPIISVPLLLLLIPFTAITHERYEDRQNGYTFLRVLPLKKHEIVAVKFLLILLIDALAVSIILTLPSLISMSDGQRALSAALTLLAGNLSLIIVGLIYTGIFALGFIRFTLVAKITVMAFLVIPQIAAFIVLRGRIRLNFQAAADFLTGLNWPLITGACLILYFVLLLAAVRAMRRGR